MPCPPGGSRMSEMSYFGMRSMKVTVSPVIGLLIISQFMVQPSAVDVAAGVISCLASKLVGG